MILRRRKILFLLLNDILINTVDFTSNKQFLDKKLLKYEIHRFFHLHKHLKFVMILCGGYEWTPKNYLNNLFLNASELAIQENWTLACSTLQEILDHENLMN